MAPTTHHPAPTPSLSLSLSRRRRRRQGTPLLNPSTTAGRPLPPSRPHLRNLNLIRRGSPRGTVYYSLPSTLYMFLVHVPASVRFFSSSSEDRRRRLSPRRRSDPGSVLEFAFVGPLPCGIRFRPEDRTRTHAARIRNDARVSCMSRSSSFVYVGWFGFISRCGHFQFPGRDENRFSCLAIYLAHVYLKTEFGVVLSWIWLLNPHSHNKYQPINDRGSHTLVAIFTYDNRRKKKRFLYKI